MCNLKEISVIFLLDCLFLLNGLTYQSFFILHKRYNIILIVLVICCNNSENNYEPNVKLVEST